MVTSTPIVFGTVNTLKLLPNRKEPYFGLQFRPFCQRTRTRCLHSDVVSFNAPMSKLRCYCFVTLSLFSVACVSAWTAKPYLPRKSCTSNVKPQPLRPYKSSLPNKRAEPYINIWKVVFGAFRIEPTRTWCSSLEYGRDTCNDDAGADFSNDQAELIYNGKKYLLMPIPNRGKVSTHAIHGTLFKECCIGRYDVYRRKQRERDAGTVITSIDSTEGMSTHINENADVVAIVTVGSDLDGHNKIVHGGIIALVIDDVLGFGYLAVLLQEAELRSEKNRNNSNGTITNTFLPDVVAVTANLNVNYRAPVPSNTTIIVEAKLMPNEGSVESRREKHKFYWNVKVVSPDRGTTYCQATSLYVIPKQQLLA